MSILGKSELIKRVAAKGHTQKQVSEILDSITAEILSAISSGDEVRLTGFVTIGSKERKERLGRNPKTGAEIRIPRKTVPVLKAGKDLKDAAEGA